MTNKLTKQDLQKCDFMSWGYQAFAFNYETMQSAGFVLSIAPVLKKLYGDDPDVLHEKMEKYYGFYNTNPLLNPIITGVIVSMEESGVANITDTGVALRTGLMGAFAGLGDALFWITGRSVFGSLAAYNALNGSLAGVIVCLLVMVAVMIFRVAIFRLGYREGARIVFDNTEKFKNMTDAACKFGLAVVGAMIPSMVKLTTPLTYQMGDVTASLQFFFDTLLPSLLPVAATAAIYFGLKSKYVTTVRMIFIIIVVCIIGSAIGIFG